MNELLTVTIAEKVAQAGLPFTSFLTIANSLRQAAREVNEAINAGHDEPAQAEIVIVGARSGSVVMDLRVEESIAAPFDIAREVTVALFNGLSILEREAIRPPYFSDEALRQADMLVRPLQDGVAEIKLARPDKELVLTQRVADHVREILAPRGAIVTSIEGRIYRINLARRQFGVYDTYRQQPITCSYPEELFGDVRDALGQRVLISGKASTDANGMIQRIETRYLRRFTTPDVRQSLSELFGSDPNFTNGVDSVTYVRVHRGEETAGE